MSVDIQRYHSHEHAKSAIDLNELERLLNEYCDGKPKDGIDGLRRLFLSGFLQWLKNREVATTQSGLFATAGVVD